MTRQDLERAIVSWSVQEEIKKRVMWEDLVHWALTETVPKKVLVPLPYKKQHRPLLSFVLP